MDIPALGRPSRWRPPAGRPAQALVAALAAVAKAAWTTDTLASLADAGTMLDDGKGDAPDEEGSLHWPHCLCR